MKTLYCYQCGKKVGEINKGKIQKGSVIICKDCFSNNNKKQNYDNVDMPDIFKDIFKGRI